jgi:hypothetical protein
MKLLLAATTLFASHALAWYASGDLCYSNVECNTNCLFSQWTIGGKDSDYMFVCDKTTIDPDQFYLADCQTVTQNESGVEQIEVDDALTISACQDFGGTSCSFGCVITGKASAEARTESDWQAACTSKNALGPAVVIRYKDEDAARKAGCIVPG